MDNIDRIRRNDDTPKARPPVMRSVFLFVGAMSLYAYLKFSNEKTAMPATLLLICILGGVQVVRWYKGMRRVEAWCEAIYLLVVLSAVLGVYRNTLAPNHLFVLTTILNIPPYTVHCNRRLAVILGFLIMTAVFPITFGIATSSDSVRFLTILYALLVAGLWTFCSKFSSRAFGFEKSS